MFDYCVANVTENPETTAVLNVISSQYKRPLLEFSGSCAGCAETSYARLITQICGDRMYISNATGCSSIWGGPAATSPYTTNAEGRGPACANSLFEDNAEHGYGMYLGQKALRDNLIEMVKKIPEAAEASEEAKAAANKYLETLNDGKANNEAAKALVAAISGNVDKCETCKYIVDHKQ